MSLGGFLFSGDVWADSIADQGSCADMMAGNMLFGGCEKQNKLMRFIAKSNAKMNFAKPHVNAGSVTNNGDPRQYPRKSFPKSIFFNYRNQQYKGLIKNISRGGVFIETGAKFLFGQSIELLIPNINLDKRRRLQGWIVHSSKSGIGVTFKRIFERRSGKERRHAIDRRIGRDRRKKPKGKGRRSHWTPLSPDMPTSD